MHHVSLIEHLPRFRSSLPGVHLDLVVESMLVGNTAGELWADRVDDPSPLLLLWDRGNNVLYLAGNASASSVEALAATIAGSIRPRLLSGGTSYFKTQALSPSLDGSLPRIFPGAHLQSRPTLFFCHPGPDRLSSASCSLENVSITAITEEMLTRHEIEGVDTVREELRLMWPSENRFYERGFGVLAIRADEMICWCTSEYVSASKCGIGIATAPAYQNLGVASVTASRCVEKAWGRGVQPHWECAASNRPSARVAEKVGFTLLGEERYWLGRFGKRGGESA